MTLFIAAMLVIFVVIYGGIHLYTFLRIKAALDFHAGTGFALAISMLLMILTPLIIYMLEKKGYERIAIVMSHIGYIWMGLIFFFFLLSILFDLYRLLLLTGEWIASADFAFLHPSARQLFFIPFVIAVGIFIYAYVEALSVGTEHLTIASEKVPEKLRSFRIVQLSDVHIGLILRQGRLQKVIDLVKQARPDLVVSTGDLIDGQTDRIAEMATLLKEIDPPYGKIAIMGNHEYFAGFTRAHVFLRDAGFTLLKGEGKKIAGFLNVIGFDEEQGRAQGPYQEIDPETLKQNFPAANFMLFLKHQPTVRNRFGRFDLQLSGHTHGGQLFPFRFIVKLFFPLDSGLYKLKDNGVLYVSRGAGTWGPPARFLAPPEVTVIDLVHK